MQVKREAFRASSLITSTVLLLQTKVSTAQPDISSNYFIAQGRILQDLKVLIGYASKPEQIPTGGVVLLPTNLLSN
jgi:hypothetical protein